VCAQEAYLQLALDRVMLVPALIPPHKPLEDEPGAAHRLELCRLAIQGDERRFQVSDLELRREGASYTVDSLQVLHSRAPDSELFLIVGGDIAAGLPKWREPERVLSLSTLAIAHRPGTERDAIDRALSEVPGGERAEFFEMPEIAVSSTMLRQRVRDTLPIKYLVPDTVACYIDRHSLYRGTPQQ
jgi:nicotinate-nucleotide adenylyltransferase